MTTRIEYIIKSQLRGTMVQIYGILAYYNRGTLELLTGELRRRPYSFTENARHAMNSIIDHKNIQG